MASQGIIHSGLKYALAGKVNDLAQSISAMPEIWRDALSGRGDVDLNAARVLCSSQYLLIPSGFMGGIVKIVAQKALGGNVQAVKPEDWPADIEQSGFKGSMIFMDEPVLDVPSVVRVLAEPYKSCIRRYNGAQKIEARIIIHTAADGNMIYARQNFDDQKLETQARPLLMGLLKNAPYDFYAHLVGTSEKPVATITTHTTEKGERVWYFGGSVAERAKKSNPQETIEAARNALRKYLPGLNLSKAEWATLPVDRIEGKTSQSGWMPDTPTVHAAGNRLYCWPTKLTFAPMLGDMIFDHLAAMDIAPTHSESDYSHLPEVDYAAAPWDKVSWIKES
jgi:hypothetical protein